MSLKLRYKHRWYLFGVLLLPLVTVGFLAALFLLQNDAAASSTRTDSPNSSALQAYYLTRDVHNGSQAVSACANGYHFASMWEILDPSNYKYNTGLGLLKDDSGSGPPTHLVPGWVRTGSSSSDSPIPGKANCDVWVASDSDKYGTTASLPGDWKSGDQDLNVWHAVVQSCDTPTFVWCVEDYWQENLYLPAVMKD